MKIVRTRALKRPKTLRQEDKGKIESILKANESILNEEEKRIYKEELKVK